MSLRMIPFKRALLACAFDFKNSNMFVYGACVYPQTDYHFLSFVKEDIWMCSLFLIGVLYSLKTKSQLKLDVFEDVSPNCPYFMLKYKLFYQL